MRPTANDWVSGERVKIIGHPPSTARSFYVPMPRREMQDSYARLLRDGIHNPYLFIIYPPASWRESDLRTHLDHWAAECNVHASWIRTWSEFRPSPHAVPQSECAPGGACFVIANDCGHAFDDMQSE
jgi:hypothetical protein